MARMRLEKLVRRLFPVVACAPLVLLAGCPQENAASPGKTPAQATAPTTPGEAAAVNATKAVAAPKTAAQQAENAVNARRVQQLIARTEQTYRSGVANYRAGKLDAARQNFD